MLARLFSALLFAAPPAESTEPAESPDPPATSEDVTEIVVSTAEADRLRQSAEAVTVIDTDTAKRESADLGEVLSRSQGVGVRRGGGLGSSTWLSLNGLSGDQVRVFLDGVPLSLAGFPGSIGLANVPVNLVDRIDIYRGVVPIRFGADALGGAINLASPTPRDGLHGSVSYQGGSFETHRLAALLQARLSPSGLFARASGFFDTAANDYPITVEVTDDQGQLHEAKIYRFHDGYRAYGGKLDLGVVDVRWADHLLVHGFATHARKDIQHNIVMTVPYGEVETAELTAGGSVDYRRVFDNRVELDLVGGYTWAQTEFQDLGECVYDWFGQCIFDRPQPGEIGVGPIDQVVAEHTGFGRFNLHWQPAAAHGLSASIAPTYVTRGGDDRTVDDPEFRDPLSFRRELLTIVTGLAYTLDVLEERLENVAFGKSYVQLARSEEELPGGDPRERNRDTVRFGVGDSLRYRFAPWIWAKLSYEWATRVPRPDEIFGDGMRIVANLELAPETSHNTNLGLTIDARDTRVGSWRLDVNGFWREAEKLIVLLGNDQAFSYQNVFGARSLGVEGGVGWTSPGDYFAIDLNSTYQDFRNVANAGAFADYAGDRIPNRPYLFANGSARVQVSSVASSRDELSLTWTTRYIHEYFRGWESVGLATYKQVVPAQLLHGIVLTYLVRGEHLDASFTGEVQNLTNRLAFDYFGVQRPGRAVYFKTTLSF